MGVSEEIESLIKNFNAKEATAEDKLYDFEAFVASLPNKEEAKTPEVTTNGEKILTFDTISSFINEINTLLKFDIKEWSVIPDFDRNKLIFLIEVNCISDIEKAEEHLLHLLLTKYDIRSAIYVLENGSFEEYYYNKLALGIPAGIIKIPKVIKNPYTKQYFLGKIDERY
jgi:hypothetical protein